MSSDSDITDLLINWGEGDNSVLENLIPLVEKELRRLAHHYMNNERAGHLLQTTALVNEAYLRLINQRRVRWQNRAHFYGIAAQIMRRIRLWSCPIPWNSNRLCIPWRAGQGLISLHLLSRHLGPETISSEKFFTPGAIAP
jgi:hypothetical protein